MIGQFFRNRHVTQTLQSSYRFFLCSTENNDSLLNIGKKITQQRRFLCLGATSFVAILVLSKVHRADTPIVSRNHHLSAPLQHREDLQEKQLPEQDKKAPEMSKPEISANLKKAKAESLWGLLVADAIAMPVHWYYNPSDIKKGYGGWLTGYMAPTDKHPSSIMSLSNTGGSGRAGGKAKAVIGDVILHDKLKYWGGNNRSTHYHQGMKAGDNTLNALMALEMMKTFEKVDHDLMKADRDVRASVLEDYVRFMTTPGMHGDTYAESFHRSFFKDWSALSNPPKTAEDLLVYAEKRFKEKTNLTPDHQLASIGALVPTIPWVIRNAHKSENECAKAAVEFIKLTHPDISLITFVDMYSRLLHAVLNGKDLKTEVIRLLGHAELGGSWKRDTVLMMVEQADSNVYGSESRLRAYQSAVSSLGLACYIEGALSSLLYLALEFADDFEGGVLANANVGGENCHRGAALGALLAAACAKKGQTIPEKWKDGLGVSRETVKTIVSEMSKL